MVLKTNGLTNSWAAVIGTKNQWAIYRRENLTKHTKAKRNKERQGRRNRTKNKNKPTHKETNNRIKNKMQEQTENKQTTY